MCPLRVAAAIALVGFAFSARVPGSPYPTCSGGLNSTSTLYVYNTDSGSADDAFTVQSLQGVLSKTTPRVYHYSSGSDYVLWLNVTVSTFGARLNSTFESDAAGLVAFFAPHLSGYVLVDDSDNSTNVGIAAAAAADVIIVTTANEALATSAGLPLRWDVRGKDLAWALATFNGTGGFAYSRTVTVLQEPSSTCCMGDYAIAAGALQWWQDDVTSPLAQEVWASMVPPFVMTGWGPDEYGTVTRVSQSGGAVVASNWASNLDVFSNFDIPAFSQKPAPSPSPVPAQVHTACLLMTDGDNVQWLLDGFATDPQWFGSPDRGSVPLGWTLSPSLADLVPAEMSYLYGAASAPPAFRDVFVAGVSGVGYSYPDSTPAALRPPLSALTGAFMRKAGLSIVNVLGHGEGYTAAEVDPLTAQPEVDAVFWYNYDDYAGLQGRVTWSNGKPVIGGRFNLWGNGSDPSGPTFKNVTGLVAALAAQPRDPASPAGYSLVPLHAWSHNVSDALAVMRGLQAAAGAGVELVTPDVFVARMVAHVPH